MDSLQLQRQKEFLERIKTEEQKEYTAASGSPEMIRREMESREQTERTARIQNGLYGFADEFKSEWGKPVEAESNLYRKSARLVKKIKGNEPEPYFSLNSFAYGSEILNPEKVEDRSGPALDLKNSLNEWNELLNSKNGMPEPGECVDKLFQLSLSSSNYCITHEKGYFKSTMGAGRIQVAEKVRKMTSDCLERMLTDKDREYIYRRGDADYVTGESDATITKDIERAAKAYHNYILQMAKTCQGLTPGEILKRKLRALRLNERKLRVYRDKNPDPDKREDLVNEMIRDFEECLAWEKLREATMDKESMEEGLEETIDQHLVEEGEIESSEKDKIVPGSEDDELEPEQLKGLEEIDNWLLRNFQNGGVTGTAITSLKNPNMEFVNMVLSLSKRERLHMYYLVEKNKRKNSNMMDVGLSQTYVPDIKAFKDQMVATRFKFWKRMNGEYTYMHKLSEAFQVTKQYRKEIKAVAEVERDKKTEMQNINVKREKNEPVDTAIERLRKMMLLKGALEEYNRNLNDAKKASRKKKAAAEAICKESAGYCEQLMKEIVELDANMEKEKPYTHMAETKEAVTGDATSKYMLSGKLPGAGQMAVIKGGQIFGKSWDLKSAGWTRANLWTGSIGEAAGGVTNLIGAVTGLITLCKTGSTMAGTEIAEKTLQMTQSLVSATQNALNIKDLVDTGGAIIKTAEQTQAKELMGSAFTAAGAVINTGIAISKAIGIDRMHRHGIKAGEYFKKKRERLEKEGKENLTKDQKRELKYEENMMKLQEDLKKREEVKGAYSAVGAGVSIASIICAPIGIVNMAISIVGSIHDGTIVTKLRTKLFDNFFNMDALAEKVMKKRNKGRAMEPGVDPEVMREKVKEALRFRVAAHAGFCDMRTAAEFVCAGFARLIREKLFNDDLETPKEERDGYIEFVKALNLPYDKKKGKPDVNTLVRKMSAQ